MDEQGGFEGLTPQRNKDDIESLRSELEQARMEIEGFIQENADGINALEQALADKADLTAIPASKRERVVHWVEGPFNALDTELTCEQIVSTDLAGEVFRDYLVNREDVMPVGVGDILALNCNISRRAEREEFDGERYHVKSGAIDEESDLEQPLLEEESSESSGSGAEEEEEEEEELLDKIEGCTYLGLVLGTDGLFQDRSPEFTDNADQVTNEVLQNDLSQRIQRVYSEGGGDTKTLYEILVWSTCTNSGGLGDDCPDEVEGVRIKELVPPESGSSEKEEHLSYIYDPMNDGSEGASNMVLSRLKSLSEGEVSGSDSVSRSFFAFESFKRADGEDGVLGERSATDLTVERGGETIGLRPKIEFVNIQTTPKSIEAEIEEVSLRSTPLQFWSKQFDKKSLEVKDVSIYSDKCGKLGLEKELEDGESETLELLAQSGDYGSSKVSIYQHTFKNKIYDGDEEEEPITVADLSKVSIFTHSDELGDVAVDFLRTPWIPMIPAFKGEDSLAPRLFSGDFFPDESVDGEKFITVKDITASLYSSTVSIATGEDYGKQVRQIHLQIAKEIMYNQFYSGLWCGSDIPPEGPQPEYIDLYANIPLSITDGFTGDKQVFIQGRDPDTGDLKDPSIEVSLGYIDTENHERTLTVSRQEVIEPVTISLGLVKEFGFESDIDLPMTGISTVKIPASEFSEEIHIKTPYTVSIFTPEYGTESGSGSESESESAPSNKRTLRITYKNEFIDTKSGLVVDRRIPDDPTSHYSTLEANFEVASVSLGISIAGFTGNLLYQGVNESAQRPSLEVKWADSIGDVANMRAIEVIQTDVVGKAKVESGLIKKEETGEQEEPLVTKGSLNIPYSDFDEKIFYEVPLAVSLYNVAPESGADENVNKIEVALKSQLRTLTTKNGLITSDVIGEESPEILTSTIELPASAFEADGLTEDVMIFEPVSIGASIITIEPESLADEDQSVRKQLKLTSTFQAFDHVIENGLVKSRAETGVVSEQATFVDLPSSVVGGTDFSGKIKQPLFINYGENINPIGIFQPVSNERAIEIGLSSENAQKNLVYEVQTQLVASKQLDVEDGLIDGLENTENSFEFMGEQSSYVLQIPKVSLGVTQGITDTINSPNLSSLSVTKSENVETGGEIITLNLSRQDNFYDVENGLIKQVSDPPGTFTDASMSFEIPPAGGTVSLGTGVTENLKVIRADATPSVTVADSEEDATKTQVQIRLATNSLEVKNGLVKAVTASEESEDELLISFDIPKSEVSGYTEKAMLVCDEDGNSRVIRVLAKE